MNGLKKNKTYDIQYEIVSTSTERGEKEPETYNLGRHGMVILDPEGNVLWSKPGHRMDKEDITEGIQTALKQHTSGS